MMYRVTLSSVSTIPHVMFMRRHAHAIAIHATELSCYRFARIRQLRTQWILRSQTLQSEVHATEK